MRKYEPSGILQFQLTLPEWGATYVHALIAHDNRLVSAPLHERGATYTRSSRTTIDWFQLTLPERGATTDRP